MKCEKHKTNTRLWPKPGSFLPHLKMRLAAVKALYYYFKVFVCVNPTERIVISQVTLFVKWFASLADIKDIIHIQDIQSKEGKGSGI